MEAPRSRETLDKEAVIDFDQSRPYMQWARTANALFRQVWQIQVQLFLLIEQRA